jgi:spore germination protein GerM
VSGVRFAAAVVAIVAVAGSCRGTNRAAPEPEAARAPQAEASSEGAPAIAAPLGKATVTLYFPSAEGEGLVAETREIVDTARPVDRGTQILAALLEGPRSDKALPAVPEGTTLRQLWVRDDGNAFADFSEELARGENAGSHDELLTVYAIVDSLTANVPAIRRVGILIAGKERETLGHLDLRRPLPADLTLAAKAAR